VRYDGRRFTVVADLVDARNGRVWFSNTYTQDEDRIYELQEKVATDVRHSIVGGDALTEGKTSRPASFAVFDKYAEGLYEFEKRSAEAIRVAIPLFQQAIDLDPRFGPAYLLLAYAYALLPEYTNEAQDPLYERAVAVISVGVQMDPSIADASATIHAFIAQKRGNWIESDREYRRGLSAEPVYPVTHQLYSQLLASVGRLDASLDQARRAYELDPQSAVLISRLAIANFWVGNLEDADRLFARAQSMNLESPIYYLAYALFRIRQGRIDDARRLAKDALLRYGEDISWVDPVFDGFDNPQRYEQAHTLVEKLSGSKRLPARVEITLWAILQDGDRAMQVAKRLISEGEIFEAELLFIPQFQVVRENAQFPQLLDAIGLTEYWNAVNCGWNGEAVVCKNAARN
jgi:adenylate cyclase